MIYLLKGVCLVLKAFGTVQHSIFCYRYIQSTYLGILYAIYESRERSEQIWQCSMIYEDERAKPLEFQSPPTKRVLFWSRHGSCLLASVPLIRAGYPGINIRANKREDYLKALFTVSHRPPERSNHLKVVPRHKLHRIYNLSWMYLHLQCLTPSNIYDPCPRLHRKTSGINFQLNLETLGCVCKVLIMI